MREREPTHPTLCRRVADFLKSFQHTPPVFQHRLSKYGSEKKGKDGEWSKGGAVGDTRRKECGDGYENEEK